MLVLAVAAMLAGPACAAWAAPGPPGHTEWWFDTWHVPALWAGGARGQGVVIGEIDTGVDASLPALAANVVPGTDLGAPGGDGRTDRDVDIFGHGTAMASLMVARPGPDGITGLAPDAKVLPVAVPIDGTTDATPDYGNDYIARAIIWAADHGARVITMSLGREHKPGPGHGRSCPKAEQDAIDHAIAGGAVVVAAGGNSGDKGSPIEDPGVCVGVLSVGAVDQQQRVPVWSSRHPYLGVTAPGVNVPSLGRVPGLAFYGDGTSQATAVTAAGLAVIWSKFPQLSGRQVEARLLATLDGARPTRDPATGFGSVDIGRAVDADVPPTAPNPLFDAVDPFVARDRAVAAAVTPPEPAAPVAGPVSGAVTVDAAAGPLAAGVGLAGVVAGGLGLLGVVVLVVGGLRGRRRRRRASPAVPPAPAEVPEVLEVSEVPEVPEVSDAVPSEPTVA